MREIWYSIMINYEDIGSRIRNIRIQRGLSQEQLAESVGVGTAHISHIETGNSTPSLRTMLDIINALDCSADELLCMEVAKAQPTFDCWLGDLLADCSISERKVITETIIALKDSLRHIKEEG